MNMKRFFLILILFAMQTGSAISFKNKDAANSTLNDRQRIFMQNNIFSKTLDLAPWNQAFEGALAFIEDNSRAAGIVGSRDKVIMRTVDTLRSANRTLINTIINAYNEYVLPKIRIEEAREYVRDNMIVVRNVVLSIEKDQDLAELQDSTILPGKKSGISLILIMALKIKTIANKAIDDFKAIAPQLTSQQKIASVVGGLNDLWLEDAQELMQEMEMHLKNVPNEKANLQRWHRQVIELNQRIAQLDPAAAKKYEQRIIDAGKKAGFTPVIKTSLK